MVKHDDYPEASCKGCLSYMGVCTCACSVDFRRDTLICPCSICLIKVTCDSDCEEYCAYSYLFVTIRDEGMEPNDKCKRAPRRHM